MTWPMLIGVVALMGYQLVDSIFISMLGTEPLAALGFTVAVNQLLIGVQIGLGIATTALISRAIGAKNQRLARNLGGFILLTGSALMAVLCIIAWVTRDLILTALDAPALLWSTISGYWVPWLISVWMGATLYLAYSVARAQGNTKLPGAVMLLTSVLNTLFDPILIFVFDWGLPGAAWATNLSFFIGSLIMWKRIKLYRWVKYSTKSLPVWTAFKDLGFISGPAMLSQLMPGIAAMTATTIVAGFGASAVASWALASRLEFFSIVIVLALTSSMPPMVGRLFGAREYGKIHQLILLAVKFVLILQAVIAVFWISLSWLLPGLLSSDPAVIRYMQMWFIVVPLSFGALGTCMIMVSTTNALGMPIKAVKISALRLFICYLPALWLGSLIAEMKGLFIGVLVGNIAAGSIAWIMYKQAMQTVENKALYKDV